MKCCDNGLEGYGTPGKVMIIGLMPGQAEMAQGKPFVGPNGQLLYAIIKAVGLRSDDFYFTNLYCNLNGNIDTCAPRLFREIVEVNPQLIITLGAPVCETLLNVKLGTVRGTLCKLGPCKAMPTVMPVSVLQGAVTAGNDLIRDFSKIPHLLSLNYVEPTYSVIESIIRAQDILDSLPRDIPITLDIETTELDTEQDNAWDYQLLCVGVGNTDEAWVFPADVAKQVTWPTDVKWLYHNGPFDRAGMFQYTGQLIPIVHDTLLSSYALDERRVSSINTPLLKLKPLCREYVGAGFWEREKQADTYKYNALDCVHTARLHEHNMGRLYDDNVASLYHDIMMPAANMFSDAQLWGCKISVETMARLIIEWLPRLHARTVELQAMATSYGFPTALNPNSPKQLSVVLYQLLGLPGGPSTAHDLLINLDHPFVDALLEHRQLDKMLSSYLEGTRDDIKHDGRIHPKSLQHGTGTGRQSYTDPPIQTIPQEHTVGSLAELRKMFIPTNDEYCIVEADYSQIEVWIGASLSEDQNMLSDLTTPFWPDGKADYHSRVTRDVLQVAVGSSEWEAARFRAKKVTFGIEYMEGAQGLSHHTKGIGCSVFEAQQYIDNWFARYPDFRKWQQALITKCHKEGEIQTIFGRKCRKPIMLDHRQDRQVGNMPIQSTAGDCLLTSAIELHSILPNYDSHILWLIHDSIVFEVAKKYLEPALQAIKYVMTKPRHPQLPGLPVEIKVGYEDWFNMKAA